MKIPQKHFGDAYTSLNVRLSDLPEWGTPEARKTLMFLQMLDYGAAWWSHSDGKESDE